MVKKSHVLFAGAALFLLFVFFSYIVHKDFFKQIDFNATVILQDHVTRRFDELFSVFSEVGKFEVMTIVLLIVLIFVRKLWACIVGVSLFIGFHVIELYGKFFVDHMPPPEFLLRTKHLVDFPQFHVRSENSYPSGHSGRALFVSLIVIMIILQNKKLSPLAKLLLCGLVLAYDAIMLLSRVYLGEHWLSDVIGGSLLGASFGLLTSSFLLAKGKKEGLLPKFGFPKYKIEIKRVDD